MQQSHFKILHYFCLILFIIVQTSTAFSQSSPLQKFSSLSRYEKRWVVFHPFIAKKTYRLTRIALAATDSILTDTVLDNKRYGGKADAFRHAFWMALLSQRIKPAKALKLGQAHEKGNYDTFLKKKPADGVLPDSVSCEMDLYNNKAGADAGSQNKQLAYNKLKKLIISLILEGKMKIIKTNPEGKYLDCEGNIIDVNTWKGKWNIPKCLVNSA